jgi:O-antigen ligase
MNLIFFLTIGVLISSVLGELGKFPFGAVGNSFNVLDCLVAVTFLIFLIWKIAIVKTIDFPKKYLWLVGFSFIGFLSLVINGNFSGILYLVRFVLYSGFFWIGFSLVDFQKKIGTQLGLVMLGCIIFASLLGFVQLIIFPNLTFLSIYGYDPHINRLAGTFLDPNFLGAWFCFGYALVVINFLKTKNIRQLFWLILLLVAILLTFSRSAWVMLAIINLFVIWFLPKKVIVIIGLMLVLAVGFVPRVQQRLLGAFQVDISASERFDSWGKGLYLFKNNPLVGIGFNNIRSVSIESGLLKPFTPDGGNSGGGVDSSWLLVIATTGISGLVSLGYFYFSLVIHFLKVFYLTHRQEYLVIVGLMIGFFVNAQFINSFFYPSIMISFFLITGFYYALAQKD